MGNTVSILKRLLWGALLLGAISGPAFSVPADPNRPLVTQSCDAAQERLIEARRGSPLLSPDEQAQVLHVALADVARLCGAEQRDGSLQNPAMPMPAMSLLQNYSGKGKFLPFFPGILFTFAAQAVYAVAAPA